MTKFYGNLRVDSEVVQKIKELKENYNYTYDEIIKLLIDHAPIILEEIQKEKDKRKKGKKYEIPISSKH